jgi:hypothetical protein
MAIDAHAPYAPFGAVEKVLETYRDTGLGGRAITPELLVSLSVGGSIAPRVVHTLRVLDLIDDNGRATDKLDAFKKAPHDSYHEVLADVVRDAYEPVFALTGMNLNEKTSAQIEDAFRNFKPDSLRPRMVTLFINLCEYVGLMDRPPARTTASRSTEPRQPTSRKPSRAISRPPRQEPPPVRDSVFNITDADLATLSDDDFEAVWAALGTLARSRARAKSARPAEGGDG